MFDLDNLPDDPTGRALKTDGIMFVKIVSAHSMENPDTGESYVKDPISNGPDIDGIYARYLQEP